MATVIYNCKHCKVGRRVEYPVNPRKNEFYRVDSTGQYQPAMIYIQACGGGRPTVYGGDTEMGLCPSCHKMMKYEHLKATINTEHVCNGICINARGGSCDCSCGGVNHGKGWAA